MTPHLKMADELARDCASELLDELKRANIIIQNALGLMTIEQQKAWGELNDRCGAIDDIGITRRTERDAVIAKAEGRAVAPTGLLK